MSLPANYISYFFSLPRTTGDIIASDQFDADGNFTGDPQDVLLEVSMENTSGADAEVSITSAFGGASNVLIADGEVVKLSGAPYTFFSAQVVLISGDLTVYYTNAKKMLKTILV